MIELPKYDKTAELGELGIRLVEAAIHDMGWIFRPKMKADVGIDGEIEVVSNQSDATGRLISVQVKCGDSYFNEPGKGYRGKPEHLHYWLDHSLPVIIVLCNPKTRDCFWAEICPANVTRTAKSWTVLVSNRLSIESKYALQQIAKHSTLDYFLPLAIHKWLYEKYHKRIDIRSDVEFPRDYHRYPYIAVIDGNVTMVDYIYDRYGRFELDELRESLRFQPINEMNCGGKRLILCLISQNMNSFALEPEFEREISAAKDLLVLRFHLRSDSLFKLCELSNDGKEIFAYGEGVPLDGWRDEVKHVAF